MKVCFVSTAHDPLDKRVVEKEAVFLAKNGYDVTHVAPSDEDRSATYKGVKIVCFQSDYTSFGNLSSIRMRIKQLRKIYKVALAQDADIYHANEFDSWLLLLFLKLRTGRKIVFDVHEFYPDLISRRNILRPFSRVLRFSIKTSYAIFHRFTDLIVFANKNIRRDFPKSLALSVDVENFGFVAEGGDWINAESVDSENGNTFTLVHVGVIGVERGLFQILKIAEKVESPNFKVKLFGRIVGTDPSEFLDEVRSRNLEGKVEYIEWLPYDDLKAELRKANAGFIFFGDESDTNKYGLPHKLFDYMAAGLCIVASCKALYVSEIVERCGAGIIVDPSSVESTANALDELCGDMERCAAFGRNAANAVEKHYNWDREAEKLLDAYRFLREDS